MLYQLFQITKDDNGINITPWGNVSHCYEQVFERFRDIRHDIQNIDASFIVIGYMKEDDLDNLYLCELNKFNGQFVHSSLTDNSMYLQMFYENYMQNIPVVMLGELCNICNKVECYCECSVAISLLDEIIENDNFNTLWWEEWLYSYDNTHKRGSFPYVINQVMMQYIVEHKTFGKDLLLRDKIGKLLDRIIALKEDTTSLSEEGLNRHYDVLNGLILVLSQYNIGEENTKKLAQLVCDVLTRDTDSQVAHLMSIMFPVNLWRQVLIDIDPQIRKQLVPAIVIRTFLDSEMALLVFDDIVQDVLNGDVIVTSGNEILAPPTGILDLRLQNTADPIPPNIISMFLDKYSSAYANIGDVEGYGQIMDDTPTSSDNTSSIDYSRNMRDVISSALLSIDATIPDDKLDAVQRAALEVMSSAITVDDEIIGGPIVDVINRLVRHSPFNFVVGLCVYLYRNIRKISSSQAKTYWSINDIVNLLDEPTRNKIKYEQSMTNKIISSLSEAINDVDEADEADEADDNDANGNNYIDELLNIGNNRLCAILYGLVRNAIWENNQDKVDESNNQE